MTTTTPRTAAAIAALLALAVALTGCSGGSSGGSGTTKGQKTKSTSAPPPRSYTEPNLVAILKVANTSLNAGGTVKDNGLVSSTSKSPGDGPYAKITEDGGSFLPAICGSLFDKVAGDLSTLGDNTTAYSASLSYGTSILSLTSSQVPSDVKSLTAVIDGDIAAATKQCSSAQITLKGFHESFSFKTVPATTDAAVTNAFTESALFEGVPLAATFIIAIDGNILIGYEGVSPAGNLAVGEKALDAAVAAAK